MSQFEIENMHGHIKGVSVYHTDDMFRIGHEISLGPFSTISLLSEALCIVEDNFSRVGYISSFVVEPEFRGQGCGRKLFNDAEKAHFNETEVDLLIAFTDHPQSAGFDLLKFYLRSGYEVVYSINGEALMANKGKAPMLREQMGLGQATMFDDSSQATPNRRMRM